jgi:ABC-2 type transport system permease protein
MPAILKYEWKSGWKSLLIWALSVGGMGLIFIILYKGMEDSMADMAEKYAKMGAFSDAFGFSTLSIATLKGYFAIEVGQIHALGSSIFAASIATVILSKEEDGHTAIHHQ